MSKVKVARKALSLEARVKVLKMLDNGKSTRLVADEFGVGRTQVQGIRKRKAEIMEEFESNAPGDRKRKMRKTGNEEINELLWKWFEDATARHIPVSGPLLKEKAHKFASDLGVDSFKASNGWLNSFNKRHNVRFGTMSGESADVNNTVVSEWKEKLTELCAGYDPKDIFNMDESGFFYRAITKKSMHVKGKELNGGKQSKQRLTIALTASMTGEKLPVLVIGKSAKPRCFKNIDPRTLPVTYRNNKKAWMTSKLFEDWLGNLDRKMRRQGRSILLFIDNCPAHPKVQLNNIKLLFFPPNTTSRSQPMDQGIIQTVKLKYRKQQLQYLLNEIESDRDICGSALLGKISVLDAIYWVSRSWNAVEESTIRKCFARCGFVERESESVSDVTVNSDSEDEDEDVPLAALKLARELFDCNYNQLGEFESEVPVCDNSVTDWERSAHELLQDIQGECSATVSDDDEEGEQEQRPHLPHLTYNEAHAYLIRLKDFAAHQGQSDTLQGLIDVQQKVASHRANVVVKQTTVTEFFSRPNID